jgi:hypothetical protein
MVADIPYDHDSNRVSAAIGSTSTGYIYDRAGQLVSRVVRHVQRRRLLRCRRPGA